MSDQNVAGAPAYRSPCAAALAQAPKWSLARASAPPRAHTPAPGPGVAPWPRDWCRYRSAASPHSAHGSSSICPAVPFHVLEPSAERRLAVEAPHQGPSSAHPFAPRRPPSRRLRLGFRASSYSSPVWCLTCQCTCSCSHPACSMLRLAITACWGG